MSSVPRYPLILGLLLGAALLGLGLLLHGLVATLQLGDANIQGFLLIPKLPTPLYIVMAIIMLIGVGLTLLVSIRQRRRKSAALEPQRQEEPTKTPWQIAVSMLTSLVLLIILLIWLVRHGAHVHDVLQRLRLDAEMAQELFAGARDMVQQVSSATTGYALFAIVLVVYGGLGLLALWVLFEDRQGSQAYPQSDPSPQAHRVRRAVQAGLRELQVHRDPRAAIIACYARLEHLLEDYGMPVVQHLTPQEYMGLALQGLDLPLEALAGLVTRFELARYSLHPLHEADRHAAIAHLEDLQAHLEGRPVHATGA